MKRILVFGYLGYVSGKLDGQTVKTRSIYKLLCGQEDAEVRYADTESFRSHPADILRFVRDLFWCTTLVWLPAHNNLRVFFRPLWLLSRIAGFSIVYVVIGGWLSEILKQLPYHRKHLGKIKAILVENETTINELRERYGYQNLAIIPNFRFEHPCEEFTNDASDRLRLVFMARVDKNKGLETVEALCKDPNLNFNVDFYGPVNPEHAEYFKQLIASNENLSYLGEIQPQNIRDVLVAYDAMILPTKYYTEGLPGSVVDAYMAGLPVLVTRWKHAPEFVVEGRTGFIADFENPVPELSNAIQLLTNNRELLRTMKANAAKEAGKYTAEMAETVIRQYI